jgi:hypothetical protein
MCEHDGNLTFANDDSEPNEHERRLGRLYGALRKMDTELDDLTAIVVANTYFEFYVRHLLSRKADLTRLEVESDPLNMAVLIRMARSLDLMPDDVALPLVALVRLRNKFAHNVDYILTEDDLIALEKRMNESQRVYWDFFNRDFNQDKEVHRTLAHRLRTYILVIRVELEELYDPSY